MKKTSPYYQENKRSNSISSLWCWVILCILFFNQQHVFANAAQPGVWNAGGSVFTMLYPEDSLSFKKIQMVNEHIYIQLYKGYAVVKGEYVFKNTTDSTWQFKMGYPVNGIYRGGESKINQVHIDGLNQFKIKSGNNWLSLLEQPNPEYGKIQNLSENWKVWEMDFKPAEEKKVSVYFIVNTNDGLIRSGYSTNNYNAFIYLLESGSIWKQPIVSGHFYIQLMDGLKLDYVKGISDGFDFRYNKKYAIFAGSKSNFSPTPKDNLIITYYKRDKLFRFNKIPPRAAALFAAIDTFSLQPLDNLLFDSVELGNPYTVEDSLFSVLSIVIILFPVAIGLLVVWMLIWIIRKRIKAKEKML